MNRAGLFYLMVPGAAAYLLTPSFIALFERSGLVSQNHGGRPLVQGAGLLPVLLALVFSAVLPATDNPIGPAVAALTLTGAGLLGFIDDVLGQGEHGGLYGHTRAALAGRLTTGAVKAVGGLALAAIGSRALGADRSELMVSTLVLALTINLLNLLDLRPGRAIKGYLIIVAVFTAAWPGWPALPALGPLLPFTGAVVGYAPFDLQSRAMLGDAGANALGAAAGLLIVSLATDRSKLLILAALISLHLLSEMRSFSNIIDGNRLLSWLDHLGRSDGRRD